MLFRVSRRFVPLLILLVAGSSAGQEAHDPILQSESGAERPHIVLITLDDMNWDSVGAFGCKLPGVTPNIDQLAKDGVCFDQAHVTIAICMPTRAALMTARYPHRSGALGFDEIIPNIETLPEVLRKAGYHTTLVGKEIHVIPSRHEAAFDRVRGSTEFTNQGRGPSHFYQETKLAIEAARDAGKPMFLNINSADPHRPFAGSKAEANRIKNNESWSEVKEIDDPYTSEEIEVPGFLPDLPEIREEIAQYYTSVRRGDESVGQILKAIDDAGLREDTLVVFFSDHGIAVPFGKTNCYMHSTKTPLVIRWPAHVRAGRRVADRMVSTIDLAPTILAACGLAPLADSDGESFLPLLLGERDESGLGWGRQRVYTSLNYPFNRRPYPMRSVIEADGLGFIWNGWGGTDFEFRNESQSGMTYAAMVEAAKTDPVIAERVKLFVYRVPAELYNYADDPDALNNLIDDPAYKNDLVRLQNLLLRQMRQTHDPQLGAYRTYLSTIGDKNWWRA